MISRRSAIVGLTAVSTTLGFIKASEAKTAFEIQTSIQDEIKELAERYRPARILPVTMARIIKNVMEARIINGDILSFAQAYYGEGDTYLIDLNNHHCCDHRQYVFYRDRYGDKQAVWLSIYPKSMYIGTHSVPNLIHKDILGDK